MDNSRENEFVVFSNRQAQCGEPPDPLFLTYIVFSKNVLPNHSG